MTLIEGKVNKSGTKIANTTVKNHRVSDQLEAYNITKDPLELRNLVHSPDPAIQAILAKLAKLLEKQCQAKRLTPTSGLPNQTVPGQLDCQEI